MNVSEISNNGYNLRVFYGAMPLTYTGQPLRGGECEEAGWRKPTDEVVPGYKNDKCHEPGNTC
jgi:hypothetical protein